MRKKQNIGLFFGSFNPIHVGHVMIANYMVEFEGMDEVWFIVSPQNPFKSKDELLPQEHRLAMVQTAIREFNNIKASDIEFSLPQPSYTINSVTELSKKFPEADFHILMGTDNIVNIHRWKEAEKITENYHILVYPRNGYPFDAATLPAKAKITKAPIVDISSTMMREWISAGHDVRAYLPHGVYEYIKKHKLL